MKKTFLIFILLFICSSAKLFSANEIIIRDTVLSRIFPTEIVLQGQIDQAADSIQIKLKFNSNDLKIIGIYSSPDNIIEDAEPSFSVVKSQNQISELIINSKKINPSGKFFCKVKLIALRNSDSICTLEPIELKINSQTTNATFKSAIFNVLNPNYVADKSEIGYFYPCPFDYESKIEFTLIKDNIVNIFFFNTFGQLVKEIDSQYNEDEFLFLNSKNEIFRFNPNENLPAGRYYFNWQPIEEIWPSGPYFIIIKIGSEVFKTNVMLLR